MFMENKFFGLVFFGVVFFLISTNVLWSSGDIELELHPLKPNIESYFSQREIKLYETKNFLGTTSFPPSHKKDEINLGKIPNIPVSKPEEWPKTPYGRLQITFPNKAGHGSGTLISSNIVFTVAHNVYDRRYGGWIKEIEFTPSENGQASSPFGSAKGLAVAYFEKWKKVVDEGKKCRPYDIALIILDKAIGYDAGWHGIAHLSPRRLGGRSFNIFGYPGDKSSNGFKMCSSNGKILKVRKKENILYENDTYRGNSGSGISVDVKNHEKNMIVGVHVGFSPEDGKNIGCLISKKKFYPIFNALKKYSLKTHETFKLINITRASSEDSHSITEKEVKRVSHKRKREELTEGEDEEELPTPNNSKHRKIQRLEKPLNIVVYEYPDSNLKIEVHPSNYKQGKFIAYNIKNGKKSPMKYKRRGRKGRKTFQWREFKSLEEAEAKIIDYNGKYSKKTVK